ncbi:MAG: phosphotransferase family protein, partial [Patulibacter sp.]|nr:phosphotransferase family protein [Patulibacter sp.]
MTSETRATTAPSLDEGLDLPALTSWLQSAIPGLVAPLDVALIAGGQSNLTYRVRDSVGRAWVVRRPPLGNVLESAHDVAREFRIVAALQSSAVPVPKTYGVCEDRDVIGAPFYAMEFVEGLIVRDVADAVRLVAPAARRRASDDVVDVLAAMHAVDPVAQGLGTLSRHDAYVERQLRRMHRQFEAAATRAVPTIVAAHERLSRRIPAQQRTSIVHGDYRIDNVVLRTDGTVAAVLDWELCTLGDPLADVGMTLTSWLHPGEDATHLLSGAPSQAPGFATRAAFVDRYAVRSGLDLSDLPYYVAFGCWKLACIAEGIHARYASGAMGSNRQDQAARWASKAPMPRCQPRSA